MSFIKKHLQQMEAYKISLKKYEIKLNANEGKNNLLKLLKDTNYYTDIESANHYPDHAATALKEALSKYANVNINQIMVGNGSNEILELVIKSVILKDDIIYTLSPTFEMYKQFCYIYEGLYKTNTVKPEQYNLKYYYEAYIKYAPKIIIICNPNNPTGSVFAKEEMIQFIRYATNSLIIVDEAYMDFSDQSLLEEAKNYDNLIVLRTLSKALGLAGIRVGYAVANQTIVEEFQKLYNPYHLSTSSQLIATHLLAYQDIIINNIRDVKREREYLYKELQHLNVKVYPSHANFIYFFTTKNFYEQLLKKNIIIRQYYYRFKGYYRVTVGTKFENEQFVKCMKEVLSGS